MNLLGPWFLAGLAAIAVPLWLHLVARRAPRGTPFPSLMFVKRVTVPVVRRRKLRDPLLFALRCLAIACLAAALAKPVLPELWASDAGSPGEDETARTDNPEQRAVLIALDTSGSMRAGNRFARARDAALAALNDAGEDRPVGLITFDEQTTVWVRPGARQDAVRVRRTITEIEPGYHLTRLRSALGEAGRILAEFPGGGTVVLISDLQRSLVSGLTAWRPPPAFDLQVVAVTDAEPPANAAIVGLEALSPVADGPENQRFRGRAVVTVRNAGEVPLRDLAVSLRAGDRLAAVMHRGEPQRPSETTATNRGRELIPSLAPQQEVRIEFSYDLERGRSTPLVAEVITNGDALPADNRFHAVARYERPFSVLLAGAEPGNPSASSVAFVASALAVAKQPSIELAVLGGSDRADVSLAEHDLVILDGTAPQLPALANNLQTYLNAGGAVLVLADTGSSAPRRWPGELTEVLPATRGDLAEHTEAPLAIAPSGLPHPLSRILGDPLHGLLSKTQVFTLRELSPRDQSTVLLRSTAGHPLLLERPVGNGQVWMLALGLEPKDSTLGRSAGFAPWLIALLRHAAHRPARDRSHQAWLQVGQAIDLRTVLAAPGSEAIILESPAGEGQRLSGTKAIVRPDTPGFYEIHAQSATAGGAVDQGQPLAINFPPDESDLTSLDATQVRAAFDAQRAAPGESTGESAKDTLPISAEMAEAHTDLWWRLLLAGLMVLLIEGVLAANPRRAAEAG